MAIQGFDYKEQWIGTQDTSAYTFDFLITNPSQLHVYIQDQFGNIINDTDGTDDTVFSGVIFDPVDGGGTVNLVSVLPNNYVMTIFLANDQPDQPTSFPNARSFTFDVVEAMIDYVAAWGQRIAYLAQRAIRLHDLDDVSAFDVRLPLNLSTFPSQILVVRDDGAALDVGPTVAQIIASAAAAANAGASSYRVKLGNSRASPTQVGNSIAPSLFSRELQFIVGMSGPVDVTLTVPGGTSVGQELLLMGTDNINTVQLNNGNGLDLSGAAVLGDSDMISLIWDGTNWVEMWRRQAS